MQLTESFLMAAGCPGGDQCGKDYEVDLSPLNFTDYGAATVDDGGGYAHADVTPTIEDYVYEYGNESMTVPLEELPVGIIYGMTFLLGITGNTLVIVSVLRYRRMQNVTNIFLISLASADLLLVALCVPIKLAKWWTFTWAFGEVLCKLVHYLQNVSAICSILTLTAISIERYYAIIHPMRAKYGCTLQRARRIILWLWLVAFASATPIIFGQVHELVGVSRKAYWCIKKYPEKWQNILYDLSMLTIIFIVPLTIMTFAYVSICREMTQIESQRAAMRTGYSGQALTRGGCPSSVTEPPSISGTTAGRRSRTPEILRQCAQPSRDDARTRRQVIKMLITIIALFALCWGPLLIDNVLIAFEVLDRLHYGHLKPMRQAFSLMAYANSCLNPIVYAFMSKNFRSSFQNTLYSFIRRKKGGTRGVRMTGGPVSSNQSKMTQSTSYPALLMDTSMLTMDNIDQSDLSPRSGCSRTIYSGGYSTRLGKGGCSPRTTSSRSLTMESKA